VTDVKEYFERLQTSRSPPKEHVFSPQMGRNVTSKKDKRILTSMTTRKKEDAGEYILQ
jgi:tRNA G46 methylase TrmB